jgi:hypothetical protein
MIAEGLREFLEQAVHIQFYLTLLDTYIPDAAAARLADVPGVLIGTANQRLAGHNRQRFRLRVVSAIERVEPQPTRTPRHPAPFPGGTHVSMITDNIREFMDARDYQYADLGDDCFRLHFTGKNAEYNMLAQTAEEPAHVMVFTYCPVKVPEDTRGIVADYINRVNYGLTLGCLEMDPDDGGVRARSSTPVGSGEVPASVFGPIFDSSFYLLDNWLPGLLRVAFGSVDPKTAYVSVLDSLRAQQSEPSHGDSDVVGDADKEVGVELTAIEQEVSSYSRTEFATRTRLRLRRPDSGAGSGRKYAVLSQRQLRSISVAVVVSAEGSGPVAASGERHLDRPCR